MAGSLAHPRHSGLGGRAGSATFRAVARWLHLRGQGSASRPGAARVREGSGQPVMTQPATGARDSGDQPRSAERQAVAAPAGPLPPGQYIPRALPVLHYGPVPVFNPDTWDLRILGATASGDESLLSWQDVERLPGCEVTADFHCVTKFTVPAVRWSGISVAGLLRLYPPAAAV